MWDDPAEGLGRQRKRKLGLLKYLLGTALLSLALLWGLANYGEIQFDLCLTKRSLDGVWKTSLCDGEHPYVQMDDITVCFVDGTVYLEKPDGSIIRTFETEFSDPRFISNGKYALIWEAGGRELIRVSPWEELNLSTTGNILDAVVSQRGSVSVIVSQSGSHNALVRYNERGEFLSEKGYSREALFQTVFLRGTNENAELILRDDGTWILAVGGREVELAASVVYEMKPWGSGVALWTDGGLICVTKRGEIVAKIDASPREVIDWDADSAAAVLLWNENGYQLVSVSKRGIVRDTMLTQRPLSVSAGGSTLCVLTAENVNFYNVNLECLEEFPQGAFARSADAFRNGAYLFGEGEKTCLMMS